MGLKVPSRAALEALVKLSRVDEAIRRGDGILATFEADCRCIGYATDFERLANRGLCKIENVGRSQFVTITPKGREWFGPQS